MVLSSCFGRANAGAFLPTSVDSGMAVVYHKGAAALPFATGSGQDCRTRPGQSRANGAPAGKHTLFRGLTLAHRLLSHTIIALFRLVRIVLRGPSWMASTTRPALLACGLAAAATGASIFTNPINRPPNVTINVPSSINPRPSAQFTPTAHNHHTDALTLHS